MTTLSNVYTSLANLDLWFKVRGGDPLALTDVPQIIPLRWAYFRDNWEFIKQPLINSISSYSNPDFLKQQITEFDTFIAAQRVSAKNTNPFSDGLVLNKYYAVFDNILITSINLSNEEARLIALQKQTVNSYTKNDFLNIKTQLDNYRDSYSDIVGLTDSTYNSTVGRSPVTAQLTATIIDANMLLTIQNGIKSVDFILANLFAVDTVIDPFTIARTNANNPDINIGQYASGSLVRMNYGEDLESLASRYLGDPNKWLDIAIANGLQPPYIDEVGTQVQLLSNGSGNQINIAQNDSLGNPNINKFFINQAVFLQSNTQPFADQRYITNLRQIPVSGEIVLQLSGTPNLSEYKVSDSATVRVYQPNTINSGFFILIPSNEPLPDTRKEEIPWFLESTPLDEQRAKVDIAIDDNGEINFGTNGDLMLSYGLQNAVQAIKLKVVTELGSLRYHPEFGLVSVIGNKNNNLDSIKSQIVESLNNQIQIDSRFDRIETLSVDYLPVTVNTQGPMALLITMSVRLAGGSKVIPISFTVKY